MEKTTLQNLVGHVSRWQMNTIESLSANNLPFYDMAWNLHGIFYKDCRCIYASRSEYFMALFSNEMRKGTTCYEDVTAYKVGDLMGKKHIFDMIRIFCHTGIVQVEKGEPIRKTLDRYSAFHYYQMEGGMQVVRQVIMDVINPTNAMQALEYALGSPVCDSGMISDIEKYISVYAFLVFKHRSFCTIKIDNLPGITDLCQRDDLNITEIELLRCIYRLCHKKVTTDKDFEHLKSSWGMMTHRFSELGSLWDHIRVSSISIKEFVGFIRENEDFMSNDDSMTIVKFLDSNEEESSTDEVDVVIGEHISKKRKRFQPISLYPRNLHLHGVASPQTDITYWDDSRIKIFFTFDYSKKETVVLPPIPFNGYILHCTVYHSDKSIGIKGTIHRKDQTPTNDDIRITSSVVNFKLNGWKKKSIDTKLKGGIDFDISHLLSWNTIENTELSGGYLFNLDKYPEYNSDGTWLMMSLVVDLIK